MGHILLLSPFHSWELLGLEKLSMVPKITLWSGRARSQLQVTASRAQRRNDISVGPRQGPSPAGGEVPAGWGCRGAGPEITVAWEWCMAVPQAGPFGSYFHWCPFVFLRAPRGLHGHFSVAQKHDSGLVSSTSVSTCRFELSLSSYTPALLPGISGPSWAWRAKALCDIGFVTSSASPPSFHSTFPGLLGRTQQPPSQAQVGLPLHAHLSHRCPLEDSSCSSVSQALMSSRRSVPCMLLSPGLVAPTHSRGSQERPAHTSCQGHQHQTWTSPQSDATQFLELALISKMI